MTSRRSFFKRLASLAAVVALAPEIAFSRKLDTKIIPADEPSFGKVFVGTPDEIYAFDEVGSVWMCAVSKKLAVRTATGWRELPSLPN